MRITVNEKECGTKMQVIAISVIVAVLIAIAGIFFYFGTNAGVDSAAVAAMTEIKEKNDEELNKSKQDLETTKNELEKNKEILGELKEYVSNKEKLDTDYSKKSDELNSINTQITSRQAELDKLTGAVTEAKSAPKQFSTGVYIVGEDLPAGKYDIQWVSGSGNFFGNGSPSIIEIFSNRDDFGIKTYKNAVFKNGDSFEIKGSLTVAFLLK